MQWWMFKTFSNLGSCFIGILIMVYYNPHITGYYNPPKKPKQPGFFSFSMLVFGGVFFIWSTGSGSWFSTCISQRSAMTVKPRLKKKSCDEKSLLFTKMRLPKKGGLSKQTNLVELINGITNLPQLQVLNSSLHQRWFKVLAPQLL